MKQRILNLITLFLSLFITIGCASQTVPQNSKLAITKNIKQNNATRVIVQDSITKELNWVLKESLIGGSDVIQQLVKATESIDKGQAVYVSGASGSNILVSKASNNSESSSSKTMGLLIQNLALNGSGYMVTEGMVSSLNTSTATIGDPVWLGTNGNLIYGSSNKPYAPNHLVFIGIVTRVSSTVGEIYVKIQNGFELDEIHDVDLKTNVPVNGQVLGYNGTLWVNKTIAGWLGFTPANDSNVVHKTGAETIAGQKTFSDVMNLGNPSVLDGSTKLKVNGNIELRTEDPLGGNYPTGVLFKNNAGTSMASVTGDVDGYLLLNSNNSTIINSFDNMSIHSTWGMDVGSDLYVNINGGSSGVNINGGATGVTIDALTVTGNTVSNSFVKTGGLASEYLMADGSVSTRPYKIYTALLSQSGTSAPVATVLENTLGGTVVWSRTGVGEYIATLSGVFTPEKTLNFISYADDHRDSSFGWNDVNTCFLTQYRIANSGDPIYSKADGMYHTSIEIRVYN